jgi:predicted glycosyltransferase
VADLRAFAQRASPDVALSHNSYAQLAAARSLRIPAVTAMDFEHQPANHLGFRLARTVLLPRDLKDSRVVRQGASRRKSRFYPGLKEEVYLGDFTPDPAVLQKLGICLDGDSILVVARTPPSRALYHDFESPLFLGALEAITSDRRTQLVILVRHPEQRAMLEALQLPRCTIPTDAVDSRSLMHAADLVLGAGGTMTREAALMGVPTFSLFAGRTPAVDTWLEQRGALRQLGAVEELLPLRRRSAEPVDVDALRGRSSELIRHFVAAATLAPAPAETDERSTRPMPLVSP